MNAITTIFKSLADTKVGKFSIKHAPQISMILGGVLGAGAIATTVVSTKRTIDLVNAEKVKRAEKQNEEAKKARGSNPGKQDEPIVEVKPEEIKIKPKEVVIIAWKSWIVPTGLAAGSLISFIAAYKFEHNKTLKLAGMLSISEAKLVSVEKEMVEKLGEKKAEEIRREVREKDIPKEPEKKESEKKEADSPGVPTDGLKIQVIESVTGQSLDETKFSNVKYAIKDAKSIFENDGELNLNSWLCLLEEETGIPLKRSCVGENLKLIRKRPGEDFEKDIIRISWNERADHEPMCFIEYREPWVYEK